MKIGLYRGDRGTRARVDAKPDMKGEVQDDTWVRASIDAARAYLDYSGGEHVTVRDEKGARIATVSMTIHEDAEGPS